MISTKPNVECYSDIFLQYLEIITPYPHMYCRILTFKYHMLILVLLCYYILKPCPDIIIPYSDKMANSAIEMPSPDDILPYPYNEMLCFDIIIPYHDNKM